jgi:hypothetical protein
VLPTRVLNTLHLGELSLQCSSLRKQAGGPGSLSDLSSIVNSHGTHSGARGPSREGPSVRLSLPPDSSFATRGCQRPTWRPRNRTISTSRCALILQRTGPFSLQA